MITLKQSHIDAIFEHGREGHPDEVCGIILGSFSGDDREAIEVMRAGNLNSERSHDRYELDPKDLVAAERKCRESGLEVIGLYHSHPDHPDAPSEFDRERAWPVYSYLIVSVMKGEDCSVRSWQIDEETERFIEEKINIAGD